MPAAQAGSAAGMAETKPRSSAPATVEEKCMTGAEWFKRVTEEFARYQKRMLKERAAMVESKIWYEGTLTPFYIQGTVVARSKTFLPIQPTWKDKTQTRQENRQSYGLGWKKDLAYARNPHFGWLKTLKSSMRRTLRLVSFSVTSLSLSDKHEGVPEKKVVLTQKFCTSGCSESPTVLSNQFPHGKPRHIGRALQI
jgi:hypothetical protein